jgi:hypothetical protein
MEWRTLNKHTTKGIHRYQAAQIGTDTARLLTDYVTDYVQITYRLRRFYRLRTDYAQTTHRLTLTSLTLTLTF